MQNVANKTIIVFLNTPPLYQINGFQLCVRRRVHLPMRGCICLGCNSVSMSLMERSVPLTSAEIFLDTATISDLFRTLQVPLSFHVVSRSSMRTVQAQV